jgi:hypothetical protein
MIMLRRGGTELKNWKEKQWVEIGNRSVTRGNRRENARIGKLEERVKEQKSS